MMQISWKCVGVVNWELIELACNYEETFENKFVWVFGSGLFCRKKAV
jgi:hypothetical protein